MPATTSGYKLPYPLGTDRVMDGDDQIRKLAQSVENMVQGATASINVTTGGSSSSLAVTFPVAYLSAPTVVVVPQQSSANVNVTAVAASPSATAVTLSGVRATAGALTVMWIAVGPVVAVA